MANSIINISDTIAIVTNIRGKIHMGIVTHIQSNSITPQSFNAANTSVGTISHFIYLVPSLAIVCNTMPNNMPTKNQNVVMLSSLVKLGF